MHEAKTRAADSWPTWTDEIFVQPYGDTLTILDIGVQVGVFCPPEDREPPWWHDLDREAEGHDLGPGRSRSLLGL